MQKDQFEFLVRELRREADELLLEKGQDYAPQEDVLQNFKVDAAFLGLDPKLLCMVYMTKHLRAVSNSLQGHSLKVESVQERLRDVYNYIQFLYAMVEAEDASRRDSTDTPIKGG